MLIIGFLDVLYQVEKTPSTLVEGALSWMGIRLCQIFLLHHQYNIFLPLTADMVDALTEMWMLSKP